MTQPLQKPIVVVGSINADLVAVTERIPAVGETVLGGDLQIHPGGKGANQAVAVARLGYPVRMIGRLGDDVFGTQLRTHLHDAGVDTAGVATSKGASGAALIVVSASGDNSIVVSPGANELLTPQDLDENIEVLRTAGVVLAQLETPLETVEHLARLCQREAIPLILDPAPARRLRAEIFRQTAWITPNESEARFYLSAAVDPGEGGDGAIAQQLLHLGTRGVVLKLGSRGAYIASREGIAKLVPSFAVRAIDTTAAGDCFNGAFATGLMMGKSAIDSARFATAAAAISVTRAGAQPSMPTRTEVEELLRSKT